MTEKDLLNMMIAKLESVKERIEDDYSKGKLSFDSRNHSLFYNDIVKYDIQKTLQSLTTHK